MCSSTLSFIDDAPSMIPMSTNPIEHDTQLLELYRAQAKAEQTLVWKDNHYRGESQTRTERQRYGRSDNRSIAEVAADMQARRDEAVAYWNDPEKGHTDPERMVAYVVGKLDEVENSFNDAVAAVKAARDAIKAHEANYTGWDRFFLVTSSNGLVHSSMNCSTCNKGRKLTTFALLPSFSDRPVDGLVTLFGPALCSVCFPSAPVDWTDAVRVPARIATMLLELGEDEFRAELTKYQTKQAAKAAAKKGR